MAFCRSRPTPLPEANMWQEQAAWRRGNGSKALAPAQFSYLESVVKMQLFS